jgi:hypothetical protein
MDPETLGIVNTISQAGLFLATLGLVYVAYWQVNKVREQSNADFIARLNREFFYESAMNPSIIRAIGERRPILKKNGGEFTEYDIHAYLRYFEMIERFIDCGVISLDLVDEMFGSNIARAWENDEIRKDVLQTRERRKDVRYFEHFEKLAKDILEIEKKYSA